MTDLVTAPPAPVQRRRRRPVVAVLVVIVVAALLVAAGGAAYWWRHPRVFPEPDGMSVSFSVDVGQPPVFLGVVNSGAITRSHDSLTLTGGRVRFSGNSAGATATLLVCRLRNGSRIGAVDAGDPALRRCRPLRAGTRMRLPDDYVVAAVRVRRPGRATLTAVDLGYRRDERWLRQRGTQQVEQRIVVRATRPG